MYLYNSIFTDSLQVLIHGKSGQKRAKCEHIFPPSHPMAERLPPVHPVFSPSAQRFDAVCVCRSCVDTHKLPHDRLMPFPSAIKCGVKTCENYTSYLVIADPLN